jgi:hypothetical protein
MTVLLAAYKKVSECDFRRPDFLPFKIRPVKQESREVPLNTREQIGIYKCSISNIQVFHIKQLS